MFERGGEQPIVHQQPKEKEAPAFLMSDYVYQAIGDAITDMDTLDPIDVYEIKCHQCEMSIRSQGRNIKARYDRRKSFGCVGCGNKELIVRRLDTGKA